MPPPSFNSQPNAPARPVPVASACAASEPGHPPKSPRVGRVFRMTSLPPEIRNRICSLYFRTLAPLELTSDNASQPLHLQTPLPLSLALTIPRDIYYTHATFSLSSCMPLRALPQLTRVQIRRLRVLYEKLEGKIPDWMNLITKTLPCVKELVFVVELIRLGVMIRDGWCEYVSMAIKKAIRARANGGLFLKVECGSWGTEEWVGQVEVV